MKRLMLVLGPALLFFGCEQVPSARTTTAPVAVTLRDHHAGALAPGDQLTFTRHLEVGQTLYLLVAQQGVDVRLDLVGPVADTIPVSVDGPTGASGPEELWFRADHAGLYRITLTAGGRLAGRYALSLQQPDAADPEFQHRLHAFTFAQTLAHQAKDAEVAPTEWETLVRLWRQTNHPRQTAAALYFMAEAIAPTERPRAIAALDAAWLLLREHNAPVWAVLIGNRLAFHTHLNGEPERADRQWQATRDLARQHGLTWWEGFVLKHIGLANHGQNRYDEAVTAYNQAISLFERSGDTKQQAQTQIRLAQTLILVGRLIDADDALDRAEALNHNTNLIPVHTSILLQRGWLAQRRGDYSRAEALIQQALRLKTELAGAHTTAGILDRLGTLYQLQGYWTEADATYERALAVAKNNGRADHVAMIRTNMARSLLSQDRIEEIDLRESLATFTKSGDADSAAQVHAILAEQARHRDQSLTALAHLENALTALDNARGTFPDPHYARPYIAARFDLVTQTRDLLFALDTQHPGRGYAERALALIERVRARTLREQLAAAPVIPNDAAKSALAKVNELELQRLRAEENEDAAAVATLSASIRDQLRALPPLPARAPSPSFDLVTLRAELLHPDRRLVVYALGEPTSRVLVIGPNSFVSRALPGRKTFLAGVDGLMNAVTGHNPVQTKLLARKLGALLLAPIQADIAGKELLIIKDDGLHALPFAMLHHPRSDHYLVQDHLLGELPSASIGVALARRARTRERPTLPAAVFADAVYPQKTPPDLNALQQAFGRQAFQTLAWSAREAEAVARLASDTDLFLRQAASRAQLQALVGQRRPFLHFAVHGLLHSETSLSGLVLSLEDARGYEVPGFLRLHQLEHMHFPVDLVVLSACQTALGTRWRGEGPVGPGRAFHAAGATHVLMSTWRIRDGEATVNLMTHFYDALLQRGLPPAAAWRQAQLAMIDSGADPYAWAGFLLSGPLP